ncbi:MAG: hypothetical protein AAF462_06795 [Thermodesulfobacteriota bacterium]
MTKLLYGTLIVLLFTPLVIAESSKDADKQSEECQQVLTELKQAQDQHNADYKKLGKAIMNWKNYYDQLHAQSYLNTDQPLMDSVEKCQSGDGLGEDFCKGAMKQYNEISPKEETAKAELESAKEISRESNKKYNTKLREAADKNCIMKSR